MASGATSGKPLLCVVICLFCISLVVPYLNMYIEMISLLLEDLIARGWRRRMKILNFLNCYFAFDALVSESMRRTEKCKYLQGAFWLLSSYGR